MKHTLVLFLLAGLICAPVDARISMPSAQTFTDPFKKTASTARSWVTPQAKSSQSSWLQWVKNHISCNAQSAKVFLVGCVGLFGGYKAAQKGWQAATDYFAVDSNFNDAGSVFKAEAPPSQESIRRNNALPLHVARTEGGFAPAYSGIRIADDVELLGKSNALEVSQEDVERYLVPVLVQRSEAVTLESATEERWELGNVKYKAAIDYPDAESAIGHIPNQNKETISDDSNSDDEEYESAESGEFLEDSQLPNPAYNSNLDVRELFGSAQVIPANSLQLWKQIETLLDNYIRCIPEALPKGELSPINFIVRQMNDLRDAKLPEDERERLSEKLSEFRSKLAQNDYATRGLGGVMPYADLQESFGAKNLNAIPDALKQDLKEIHGITLNENTIYEFLGLNNKDGALASCDEMNRRIENTIQRLNDDDRYEHHRGMWNGLFWLNRQLHYCFGTEMSKEMYDTFLAEKDYQMRPVDFELQDQQIERNETLLLEFDELQRALR